MTRPAFAAIACTWLLALACTRPTPGYCGGEGGAAKCEAPATCNPMTLLCERRDGGTDSANSSDGGGDASDGGSGSDAGDASADVYKGCRGNQDCEASDAGPACVLDGGQCVTCVENTDCKTTAAPTCTTDHRCVECVESTDCKVEKPICQANRCLECLDNSDCKDATKPICQATQCRGCAADSECPADPGVCMKHTDGHCATPDETIVVQNNAGCVAAATGPDASIGTAAMPACSMQLLTQLVTANRRLIVVRGMVSASSAMLPTGGGGGVSIIGQQSASIVGGLSPGLQLSSAEVYVRSVAFKLSAMAGIRAAASTLRLDGVVVDSNAGGGIFLDATQFEIRNTIVTNNGPAQEGATGWGGVFASNPLPTPPKLLQRVTIQANKGPGLVCTATITGTGVLATGNSTFDVGTLCTVSSCGTVPNATCGAP